MTANAPAQAESGPALDVRAGENGSVRCFEVEMLRQRIAHYSATGLERASELRLELYLDAADSAELSVYRGTEQVARRRFVNLPDACADRRDAVALSIALAIDAVIHDMAPAPLESAAPSASEAGDIAGDDRSSSRTEPAQSTGATPEREVAPTPPKPVPAEEEEAEDKTDQPDDSAQDAASARGPRDGAVGVDLHLGGRWVAEAAPSPVWAGALGAELWLGRRFAIDGSAMVSTTGTTPFAGARAQTRLTGGELLGCGVVRFGDFAGQGCLGTALAACSASGESYPMRFPSATVLWAASTARLALRWPDARRVSVRLVMQGHVNMVRPELRVDGSSERLAPSWVGGSLGLDMLVSLE